MNMVVKKSNLHRKGVCAEKCCVTLRKSLNLSDPQDSHLK